MRGIEIGYLMKLNIEMLNQNHHYDINWICVQKANLHIRET